MKLTFKKSVLGICMAFLLALPSTTAMAYNVPDTVRIGLTSYANKSSILISNSRVSVGWYEDGTLWEEASLRGSGFAVSPLESYYLRLTDTYSSYDEAADVAWEMDSLGYTAIPACEAPYKWTVFIRARSYESGLDAVDMIYDDSGYDAEFMNIPADWFGITTDGSTELILKEGAALICGNGGEPIRLGSNSYRGGLDFIVNGSSLSTVNELGIEEYLYSAVPSEMPKAWAEEALKAQAVTARTYTLYKRSTHNASGYELCDGTHCQVYLGYGQESPSTTTAVDATAGIVMYYNGSPINAVYSSSSGGHTASCENVWTAALAYLRGVPEIPEAEYKVWSHTYSSSDLARMAAGEGVDVGTVEDVVINKVADGGRILSLDIVGSRDTLTLTKEKIRTVLGIESRMFTVNGIGSGAPDETAKAPVSNTPVSSNAKEIYVSNGTSDVYDYPNYFYVIGADGTAACGTSVTVLGGDGQTATYGGTSGSKPSLGGTMVLGEATVGSSSNGSGLFVFSGRGWGHGVGMSQYGAKAMAENGYTYKEILAHYYTGVTIE